MYHEQGHLRLLWTEVERDVRGASLRAYDHNILWEMSPRFQLLPGFPLIYQFFIGFVVSSDRNWLNKFQVRTRPVMKKGIFYSEAASQ